MKKLVAYFSASGVTRELAKKMAAAEEADLFEIEAAVPYTAADLNWMDKSSRNVKEAHDDSIRPAMKTVPDLSGYDEILVGFPIWWGKAPSIILTFLESADLSEKRIIPFATSGGSGMGHTAAILQKSAPNATVTEGSVLPVRTDEEALKVWTQKEEAQA